jgi:hypothetical protein
VLTPRICRTGIRYVSRRPGSASDNPAGSTAAARQGSPARVAVTAARPGLTLTLRQALQLIATCRAAD